MINISERIRALKHKIAKDTVELNYYEKLQRTKATLKVSEMLDKSLTNKQKLVCYYAAKGFTSARIGEYMDLTEKAIKWHFTRIYAALGCEGREELLTLLATEEIPNVYATTPAITSLPTQSLGVNSSSLPERTTDAEPTSSQRRLSGGSVPHESGHTLPFGSNAPSRKPA